MSMLQPDRPWWKDQTLMSRLDQLAEEDPKHVYAAYPSSPLTYDKGFREVTFPQLANAVNGIAWLIERELGRGSGETLAYIGPNDIGYPALILGAAKSGNKVLLISPRNSVAAQLHLFGATGCKTILSPSPRPPQITAILDTQNVRCIDVPSAEELLSTTYEAYPYTKSFAEAKNDIFCMAHTSGSTGMPKPLSWNHQFVSTNIEHGQLPPPPGYESQHRWLQGNRVFVTFPPFHGAAIATYLFIAIPHRTTAVAPTSGAIATGQGLVDALKHTDIDTAFLVPSIVLDLAQDPVSLDIVARRVQKILYCGGDLPQAIGEIVAAKVPLYNQYGASEMGITPQIWGNRTSADWKYIEPHPGIGAELRHSVDNLYEYTLVRRLEGEEQPAVFSLFPELDEYPSKDLYVQHPTNPRLWKWQARVDDVIVFLNGEKTNPVSMEQHITTSNPDIAKTLCAGSQRFQASLIIQPTDMSKPLNTAERAAFIERIWPSIEEANKVCPAHAKIAKSHILFTVPEKPMMVAGKGTIQRAGTIAMYESELERLYADADAAATSDSDGVAKVSDLEDIEAISNFVQQTVIEATSFKSLNPEDNFFTLGMDSLQALLTLRRIRHGLSLPKLALTTVYTNPSVASLTKAVLTEAKTGSSDDETGKYIREAQSLLEKYRAEIDNVPSTIIEPSRAIHATKVLLTGSTGALGCHLLDSLLSNSSVTAVYCFNRASDGGKSLQESRLRARGLPSSLASDPRLSFYHTDLSESDFALDAATLADIRGGVTHIIHAAWAVDFNMPLSAFDSHLRGLVNLVAFAASCSQRVRYMFISSVSSILADRPEPVPETVVEDFSYLNPIGYGQSKLVAEMLLAHASTRLSGSNVEFAFARVGQLAGAIKESNESKIVTWKETEWFPSLVISSVHVGALPDSLGIMENLNWIPIDVQGQILTEMTLAVSSDEHIGPRINVFHPDNQNVKRWNELQGGVISEVQTITGKKLDVVSPQIWLDKVQQAIETGAEESGVGMTKAIDDRALGKLLELNPAVKLLDMFNFTLHRQPFVQREIMAATKASETLRNLTAIQGSWMRKWTREWLYSVGYVCPIQEKR